MSAMCGLGSGGGSETGLLTITGNTGGAVPGDISGNIDIVGSGNVNIVGDPGTNTLTITSSTSIFAYTNVDTSPYVVQSTDSYLSVDCSGMAITLQFANAAPSGKGFIVKDRTGFAATNNITVTTVGGAVDIDAAATFVMNTNYESINLMGNGSSYEVF